MCASKGMRNFFDQLHHFWGELQILGCATGSTKSLQLSMNGVSGL